MIDFYKNLPANNNNFLQILADTKCFTPVPHDWWVILTDIKDSTSVYLQNRYRDLNTVAARSLTVGLAVAREFGTEIPYIYGGDGATMVVPDEMKERILVALASYQREVTRNQELDLRVGAMSIKELDSMGYMTSVAKIALDQYYHEAIFTDSGLYYAEYMIKDDSSFQVTYSGDSDVDYDYSGLLPSWKVLYEPDDDQFSVALIVFAQDMQNHREVYVAVLNDLEEIFGDSSMRHPFVVGSEGDTQLATDALKIDGSLKSVFVGSEDQIGSFREKLDQYERAGTILYGLAQSDASIVTSIIEERPRASIALVDVADGGYIEAAAQVKKKLQVES